MLDAAPPAHCQRVIDSNHGRRYYSVVSYPRAYATQSFPQLLVIGIYERYFAPGSKFITMSKGTASSMFDNLPRQFKLVEAFMGSSKDNIMEAIFDIDVPANVTNMFDTDDELGMEDSAVFGKAKDPGQNGEGREGREGRAALQISPLISPRRDRSQASRTGAFEAPPSPLAKLFGSVRQRAISTQGDALGDIKRISEAMESLKEAALPGEKLRQEIKQLSERQVGGVQSFDCQQLTGV
jgi:hypothetical protein